MYRLVASPSDTLWVNKVVWIITISECADNGIKQNISIECAKQISGFNMELHSANTIKLTYFLDTQYTCIYIHALGPQSGLDNHNL